MSVTRADVERWVDAGVIDRDAGGRILAFEAGTTQAPAPSASSRPSMTELAAYLAVAIVGAGIVVLVASSWADLDTWLRMVIPYGAGLVALAAGYAMRSDRLPARQRASMACWLLAEAALAAGVAVTATEAGWDSEDIPLVTGIAATVVATALWFFSRTEAQIVGIAGGVMALSVGLSNQLDSEGPTAMGVSMAAFGLAGFLAVEAGVLTPRPFARGLTSMGLVFGGFLSALPNGPVIAEVVPFAVAALLIGAGIRDKVIFSMVLGVLSAFLGLVVAILRHIDDPTIAAVALIIVGLGLLAVIVLLGRSRSWRNRGTPAAA